MYLQSSSIDEDNFPRALTLSFSKDILFFTKPNSPYNK